MKRILGLDIGTNSVGWSLVDLDFENEDGKIIDMGSRVVPMDADYMKKFEKGNSISKTSERRKTRGIRRLKQRYKLRRERLIKVLKILGWLSDEFPEKFEGLNKHNINDLIPIGNDSFEECAKELKIEPKTLPKDWAIYYLRKKALEKKIEISELVRILYQFNQRRGFKSNRKTDSDSKSDDQIVEATNKNETRVAIVKIKNIEDTNEYSRGKKVFKITTSQELADGLNFGTIARDTMPEWENTEKEFEIRIKRSKQGTRIEFAMPDKSEWKKSKEALEISISDSGLHPGEYFFEQLRSNPNYKIRQRVIDRKFLKDEFISIWIKQAEFHEKLSDKSKLKEIAETLYKHNEGKQKELTSNDLLHLLLNDIIYYQRPLRSQTGAIGNCRFETKNITLKNEKQEEFVPKLKAAPVSCPLFQEFRIWKTIHNIRVFCLSKVVNGKLIADVDETDYHLTNDTKSRLFKAFDNKEFVKPNEILKLLNLKPDNYRLNYSEETSLAGNETKHFFRKAFKQAGYNEGALILDSKSDFYNLWHIFYSVNEHEAIRKALIKSFNIPEDCAHKLSTLPPFKNNYAAYSQKALRRLLSVMVCGEYWSYDAIDQFTKIRIQKLLAGEVDDSIDTRTREVLKNLEHETAFQGLDEWLATYVVYGKHSEIEGEQVSKPEQIKGPAQNSLRNPIVEQMLNETLSVVKAIWKQHDKRPDEIRVEMARDMSRNAKEREKASKIRDKNESDRKRIREILRTLNIGNPDSNADVEKLRLLENNGNFEAAYYNERFFSKYTEPTAAEIQRYKLWIEQNCVSPYTGKSIMLSKLFTSEYEVDHVIPRSRYWDDSFANKVVTETWANKEKGGDITAMQFIRNGNASRNLLSVEDYIEAVNKRYFGKKRRYLLSDEIPDEPIERQKNDTRYITKQVLKYLVQIVPPNKLRITQGMVTHELRHKWGMNDLMKRLLVDRFKRIEARSNKKMVDYVTMEDGQRRLDLEGYSKRIDHRHHAVDALVTACTTNSHIQYLNTLSSQKDPSVKYKFNKLLKSNKTRDFRLPWKSFINDAGKAIECIIVSHKNTNRVLSKGRNRYKKYVFKNGKWQLDFEMQNNKELYSIRKPLHAATFSGVIKLRMYKYVSLKEALEKIEFVADKRIKTSLKQLVAENIGDINKIKKALKEHPMLDRNNQVVGERIQIWYFEQFAVSREKLDDSFTEKKIKEKIAEYDTTKEKGIKKLLLSHLEEFQKPTLAFTGEGLEQLWKKAGRPITKVSTYEAIGQKFPIRQGQLVESAKGTNLFFVIYEHMDTGERSFNILKYFEVIQLKMEGMSMIEPKENHRHFVLSPNDLVYVPEPEENIKLIDWKNDKDRIAKRIYKMVKCPGSNQCYFIPHNVAELIVPYSKTEKFGEFDTQNSSEKTIDEPGLMIKHHCIKVKHDVLGNIAPVDY